MRERARAYIIDLLNSLMKGDARVNILKIAKKSMRGRSHLLACVCFILSIVLCLMGGISYSKYITAQNNNSNGTIGSFVCDAGIDGVSATTFAYSDFWSYNSATDSYLQMNALRTLNFTARNYTGTGASQKISTGTSRHIAITAVLALVFKSKDHLPSVGAQQTPP